jgi:RNA-directed DNA polymerase
MLFPLTAADYVLLIVLIVLCSLMRGTKLFDITLDPDARPSFTQKTIRTMNSKSHTTKVRRLSVPNDDVRRVHSQLITWLRAKRRLSGPTPWITGGLPGCSPLNNVRQHAGRRYVFTLDLASAYGSIEAPRLEQVLAERYAQVAGLLIATQQELAWINSFLTNYCLSPSGGLHMGAPASPDLFNEYAADLLDAPILALAEQYNIHYTRYMDDLTFSGERPIYPGFRARVRKIIDEAGFTVNHRKSSNVDLELVQVAIINGIALTRSGRVQLTGGYRKKLESLIHLATRFNIIPTATMLGHIAVFEHIVPLRQELQTGREQKLTRAISAYRRSLTGYK